MKDDAGAIVALLLILGTIAIALHRSRLQRTSPPLEHRETRDASRVPPERAPPTPRAERAPVAPVDPLKRARLREKERRRRTPVRPLRKLDEEDPAERVARKRREEEEARAEAVRRFQEHGGERSPASDDHVIRTPPAIVTRAAPGQRGEDRRNLAPALARHLRRHG